MDALIRTAWKAFWVGLGASAVLVGQSVLAPHAAPPPASPTPAVETAPAPPPPAPLVAVRVSRVG